MLKITPPSQKIPPDRWVPFALGFRPFFLLAGLYAALGIADWAHQFAAAALRGGYYGTIGWHSHEMLFGYALAVVAGFLLTAVRTWTGVSTPTGTSLALLALIWLSARVTAWIPAAPHWLLAGTDLAFPLLLVIAVGYPVIRARHWKSLLFPALLLGMGTGNVLVHLEALDITEDTAHTGTWLALYMIVVMMVVMGGRVIPFFTERGVPGARAVKHGWLERIAAPLTAGLAFMIVLDPSTPVVAFTAALTSVLIGLRLTGWYDRRLWRFPMIWVLHLGYFWIVTGFALQATAAMGWTSPFLAVHAFTTGGIGLLTLGMMSRVGLGHTARDVNKPPRVIPAAFVSLALAVPLRVLMPLLLPALHSWWIGLSGALWTLAFGLFVFAYAPILVKARIDGDPD